MPAAVAVVPPERLTPSAGAVAVYVRHPELPAPNVSRDQGSGRTGAADTKYKTFWVTGCEFQNTENRSRGRPDIRDRSVTGRVPRRSLG